MSKSNKTSQTPQARPLNNPDNTPKPKGNSLPRYENPPPPPPKKKT